MKIFCSICLKEKTLSDFSEGTYFTDVEDKTYCVKCFDEIKDNIICCDRCYEWAHRNENFDEHFIKTTNINNDVIYYHNKCLYDYEMCPICKKYLEIEECIDIFIDHDLQIEYHKSCIEDKDNILKYDICDYCGISLKKKCENTEFNCEYRFNDCYNEKCENYKYIEDKDRYNGCCKNCNW